MQAHICKSPEGPVYLRRRLDCRWGSEIRVGGISIDRGHFQDALAGPVTALRHRSQGALSEDETVHRGGRAAVQVACV